MGLRREDIQMNDEDYSKYYIPAMYHIMSELSLGSRTTQISEFDKLLGVNMGRAFCTRPSQDDYPIPDDWREFLAQLAGPYGFAILKVYRIKYKLEKLDEQIA